MLTGTIEVDGSLDFLKFEQNERVLASRARISNTQIRNAFGAYVLPSAW